MNCRTASELASRELDARLCPADRAGLALHALFCAVCRDHRRRLAELHAALGAADGYGGAGEELSAEARARIAEALDALPPGPGGG